MERLKKLSNNKVGSVPDRFKRFLNETADWNQQVILVTGPRGAGKTTLLLQQLKKSKKKYLYLSLDEIFFEENRLVHLVDSLYNEGYRLFALDEVHRYEHWSKDLKNIYDGYPDIQIMATGSSILEVSKGQADLSRRAAIYHLPGLSYREFLHLEHEQLFEAVSLETIRESHNEISGLYNDRVDIQKTFGDYLQYGYYPFFRDGKQTYPQKLHETVSLVLELDIAPYEELQHTTIRNMRKLLYVIGQSVPFKPNIAKLAERLEVSRNSILKMLDLMDRGRILNLLRSDTRGISYLQKPEKIYLQNPNLIYLLSEGKPNIGSVRESYFLSQLQVDHRVTSSRWSDFMVDDAYTFEVGGPSKTNDQIRGIPNAYIASDGISGGSGNRIPLWLFGFLY